MWDPMFLVYKYFIIGESEVATCHKVSLKILDVKLLANTDR